MVKYNYDLRQSESIFKIENYTCYYLYSHGLLVYKSIMFIINIM